MSGDLDRSKLDRCPKCKREAWHFRLKVEFVAPGRFYSNLSRRNRYRKDVECTAAFWETASWECHACGHNLPAPRPMVYRDALAGPSQRRRTP
jgi:hypothetical protein